jgi:hypothetical protein
LVNAAVTAVIAWGDVDDVVDEAVEISRARGINAGRPVDEKRILKLSGKTLVPRREQGVEISHC